MCEDMSEKLNECIPSSTFTITVALSNALYAMPFQLQQQQQQLRSVVMLGSSQVAVCLCV